MRGEAGQLWLDKVFSRYYLLIEIDTNGWSWSIIVFDVSFRFERCAHFDFRILDKYMRLIA